MFSFSSASPKKWQVTAEQLSEDSDVCSENGFCEYLFPVCKKGEISNKYWHLHQSIHWTAHEFDILQDKEKFNLAPVEYQNAIMDTAAILMYGDSIVLDLLGTETFNVKCISRRAMFQDQSAREMVHAHFYSKMLTLKPDAHILRSEEKKQELLRPLLQTLDLSIRADSENLSEVLFVMSLCEYILFAPLFVFINYVSTLDYCPTLCSGNLLVMRDEYIHYCHACELQTILPSKISREKAMRWTDVFHTAVKVLVCKLYYHLDIETFRMCLAHTDFIVHQFKKDNCLYESKGMIDKYEMLYGQTPAQKYMEMAQYEIKVNMMEADSTIYGTSSAVNVDGMGFD